MKLKRGAGSEGSQVIGVIILVIMATLMGFIVWYVLTTEDVDCSDVKYLCDGYGPDGKCDHYDYRMADVPIDQFVNIEWWETSGQWRVKVYTANGYVETFIWFYDSDDLSEWFQAHYAFSDEQKVDFARMMDCIKVGCPNCLEGWA